MRFIFLACFVACSAPKSSSLQQVATNIHENGRLDKAYLFYTDGIMLYRGECLPGLPKYRMNCQNSLKRVAEHIVFDAMLASAGESLPQLQGELEVLLAKLTMIQRKQVEYLEGEPRSTEAEHQRRRVDQQVLVVGQIKM